MFLNTTYSLYFHFAANTKLNIVQMRRLLRELRFVDLINNVASTCRPTAAFLKVSSPDLSTYPVSLKFSFNQFLQFIRNKTQT